MSSQRAQKILVVCMRGRSLCMNHALGDEARVRLDAIDRGLGQESGWDSVANGSVRLQWPRAQCPTWPTGSAG